MQSYLAKRNLGLPVSVACMLAIFLGYALSNSFTYIWVTAVIGAVIFSLDFDEKIRKVFKQCISVAAIAHILSWVIFALNRVVSWIRPSTFSDSKFYEVMTKISNGFGKIVTVLGDCVDIVVIVIFIILLISALSGKDAKIAALDKVTSEKAVCPKCGAQASSESAFCTKCGSSMK